MFVTGVHIIDNDTYILYIRKSAHAYVAISVLSATVKYVYSIDTYTILIVNVCK
jgi:hypothetical protein